MRLVLCLGAATILVLFGGPAAPDTGADDEQGICFDPLETFDPLHPGGACVLTKRGFDAILVIGRAIVEDDYVAPGTEIRALVKGWQCGGTTVTGRSFQLEILGNGEQPECAAKGDVVAFELAGAPATETLHWPSSPDRLPYLLSLTRIEEHSWYWFERVRAGLPAAGTVVEALVGESVCGETTIEREVDGPFAFSVEGIHGFSRLVVPSSRLRQGCGSSEDTVSFRVGGLAAEPELEWRPGVQRIDLMVRGDANCDFRINPIDATIVLQHTVNLLSSIPCHGDANHDGRVDAVDAQHILQFAAGIASALPR